MSIGLAILLAAIIAFAIYSRGLRHVVLGVIGVAAVIAGVVTLLFYYSASTQNYHDCIALMWDRKHPVQVRQRHLEQATLKCEKDRLSGADTNCDPDRIIKECEKMEAENYQGFDWKDCIKSSIDFMMGSGPLNGAPPANPCERPSLEKLRRADADASRDEAPR